VGSNPAARIPHILCCPNAFRACRTFAHWRGSFASASAWALAAPFGAFTAPGLSPSATHVKNRPHMSASLLRALGALLLGASAAAAQEARVEYAVEPSLKFDVRHVPDSSVVRYVVTDRRDSTKQVGTITFAYRALTIGGAPAFERAETWQFGDKAFVDTVVLFRRTLAPIRKHAWAGGVLSERTYDGRRVQRRPGWGQVRDSTLTETRMLPTPIFAASSSDLLASSVPLVDGYTAVVPSEADQEPGFERDTIRVTRDASAAHRWTVHFSDPFIIDAFTVDERTRQIVEWDMRRRDGRIDWRMMPR
jgi:hypothetical protein